ncbi:hypothetical protein Hanom_Chr02g00128741 [Helianthus anomalus]
MRLMLAPRSASALRTEESPIEQGIAMLPGSIFFWESLLSTRAEHSSPKLTNCNVSISPFMSEEIPHELRVFRHLG